MGGLSKPTAGDFDTRQRAVAMDPEYLAYRQKNPGFIPSGKYANFLSSDYSAEGMRLYSAAVEKAKKAGYYGPEAQGKTAGAPAAQAAAPLATIASPTNAQTITAGEVGTLGATSTKKGNAAPRGRISTILGDIGGLAETLGG